MPRVGELLKAVLSRGRKRGKLKRTSLCTFFIKRSGDALLAGRKEILFVGKLTEFVSVWLEQCDIYLYWNVGLFNTNMKSKEL